MALDNPSYFTIPGGTPSNGNRPSRFLLIKKHVRMGTSLSSTSVNTTQQNKTKKSERYSVLPTIMSAPATSSTSESSPVSESGSGRSLRSLLHNRNFESPIQTQMFVLGMPRPSDIAPSVQTSRSPKKHHARNASTGKSYRLPNSDIFNASRSSIQSDVMHEVGGNERAFHADERYYNAISGSSFLQGGRRHSIGAYFTRKPSSISRNEAQIQEEASCRNDTAEVHFKFTENPKLVAKNDEDSGRQKKCCSCQNPKGGKTGMDDIVIISSNRSQAADLWVTYLKTCFDQIRKNRNKPPFKVSSLEIEKLGDSSKSVSNLEEKLKNAKLVLFIICPVFLEHIIQFPEQCKNVSKHIRSDIVLAMLLGMAESTITEEHKAALQSYSQWKKMESVKDRDEKFVGDFLGAAMDIISKNIVQNNQPAEKGSFILMPKKVNKSQNKVIVLLNDPIAKEDVMRVTVIRNNEEFNIPAVKKRNPYTLIFRMPEEFFAVSLLVTIKVERNGVDLGTKLLKCESQLYAMVQLLKSCDSPIEFMCQALNIVPCDKDKLDDILMTSFQKNVPPNFNLLQTSGLGQLHRGVISKDEYPTLLHFAARFGLEKLCWALLECPGGELACDVRNINELTPSELAESAGHTKLANALCGYMQMTEFTSMYTFLKGMSDEKNNNSKPDTSDDYLNPRPLSETYQVPPSPRPLPLLDSHPPFGYMQMQSSKFSPSSPVFHPREKARSMGSSKERLLLRKNSDDSLKKTEGSETHSVNSLRDNSGHGIQDELIEIINDFKNNVFTISEVEKLVADWRNRNDVQQSFREKQEQLSKMREEYERVQQKVKDEMKQIGRPSPLERIRNFFRSKTKDSKSAETQEEEKKLRQTDRSLPHRPSSGLSLQSSSSSSSGRLSSGSHCSGLSLGDSGTHSDAESEKKARSVASNGCCSNPKAKEGLDNYDVPPHPVCLLNNSKPCKLPNGILNYDIPPSSQTSDAGLAKARWESESCNSSDSHNNEVNYYNLICKDIPIPNQSTLHDRLVKATSKNCLKIVEETSESKTEENNCYEYINLPSANDTSLNGSEITYCEEESVKDKPVLDLQLPDYVNVENGIK